MRRIRMHTKALAIITVVAIGLPDAVSGAPPSSSVEARRTLQRYARCTVKHKRQLASSAVVEDWPTSMLIAKKLIVSDCLTGEGVLSTLPAAMNAALGEALAVSEQNELPPAQVAAAPALAIRAAQYPSNIRPDQMKKVADSYQTYVTEAKLGECVVRGDPANSRLLLDTKIGGNDELAAATRLVPALSRCVAAGVRIELTSEIIREAVGVSYYRMEMAARGQMWRPSAATK